MVKSQSRIKYLLGFSLVFLIIIIVLSLRYWFSGGTTKDSAQEVANYSRGSNTASVVLKEFTDYQ